MTTVTVTLCPVGRGRWSPITLSYSPRLRNEQPAPMEYRRGQIVAVNGRDYRVSRVTTS